MLNHTEKLEDIIREENMLEHKLDDLRKVKAIIAADLLDSMKADTYSTHSFTVYRKPFYKFKVTDNLLAEEYIIQKPVLDSKSVIAVFESGGDLPGIEIDKEVKVLVRRKNEEI